MSSTVVWPHIGPHVRREKIGEYEIIEGKLSSEDRRQAYAIRDIKGDGVWRPVASFWSFEDGLRFARSARVVKRPK